MMNLPLVSDEENTERKEQHNRSCHETVPDNHDALGGHQIADQGGSREQSNESNAVPSSNLADVVTQSNPEHGNFRTRTLPEGINNGPNATFTLSSDQLNHIQKYGNIVLFVPGQRSILNYEYSPDYMNESHGITIYNNINLNEPSGVDLSTPTQENLVDLSGNNGENNIERNEVSNNKQKNIRVNENVDNLRSPKRLNINVNSAPPIDCESEMLQNEESIVSTENANLEDNDATPPSKDKDNEKEECLASTSKGPNHGNEKDNDNDDDDIDLSLHL